MIQHLLFLDGVGGTELILIFFVVLLLFGPKKIPELARGLGKGIRQFKDAANDINREIRENALNVDMKEETPKKTTSSTPSDKSKAKSEKKAQPTKPKTVKSGVTTAEKNKAETEDKTGKEIKMKPPKGTKAR